MEDLRRDAACTACPGTGQLRFLCEKLGGDGDGDLGRGVITDGEAEWAVDFFHEIGGDTCFAEFAGEGGAFGGGADDAEKWDVRMGS